MEVSRFNNLKIVPANAKLINKQRDIYTYVHLNGVITNLRDLNLIFQLDNGIEIKFNVSEEIYREVPEHEWGTLIYKGKEFLKFEYAGGCVEKYKK